MTVIDENLKKRTDLRSLTGLTDFHDGVSNTYLDSSLVELGKIHVLGKGHTYVVTGRTGRCCGAEGTMTTKLVDSEKLIFRNTYRLIEQ